MLLSTISVSSSITSPPTIRRQHAECAEAFSMLANHPRIGHRRSDVTELSLRFWRVGKYLIVYSESDPIEIVRVLHGRRNVAAELAGKEMPPRSGDDR